MILLVAALIVIVAIYLTSVRGEFLFDDPAILDMDFPRRQAVWNGDIDFDDPGNRASPPAPIAWLIRDRSILRSFRAFFEEPRALTHIGYQWTWNAGGLDPVYWHSVNMVLHMANTVLVYLLARDIRPAAAGFAALLFAVHPHQVAAVSYISGRANLQMTFFALAAILIISQETRGTNLLTVATCVLSILFADRSKEDGYLWVLIFGLSFVLLRRFFG